ncbi:MAG: FG-GAP-like repeat-containing protein [Planctomycetota bacterium]|nr:FG-GAP-like repeat-containing protein [Planctomycetota bacterium]
MNSTSYFLNASVQDQLPGGLLRSQWLGSWMLALGVMLALGCGDEKASDTPSPKAVAEMLARERAAAMFSEQRWEQARAALVPLAQGEDASEADLLGAAFVELEVYDLEAAGVLLDRIGTRLDNDPRYQWARFRLARHTGDSEAALGYVQRAHELAPDSYPTRLALAAQLWDLDRDEEAEEHLRALVELGETIGGSWYRTAAFKLHRLLIVKGEQEESMEWLAVYEELGDRNIAIPTDTETERGDLGLLPAPDPVARRLDPPAPPPSDATTEWSERQQVFLARRMVPMTLRLPTTGKEDLVGNSIEVRRAAYEPPAFLMSGATLQIVRLTEQGEWRAQVLLPEPVEVAMPLDADRDGDLDLVFAQEGQLGLLVNGRVHGENVGQEDDWQSAPQLLLKTGGEFTDITPVDFDHEGDLDLLVVGTFGVRLLRNDGFGVEGGGFTDVTVEAGLPRDSPARWSLAEDLDIDQDVDLVLGLDEGPYLASNERGGLFSDQSARLPDFEGLNEPWVGDLDGDGRPDLFSADGEGVLHLARVPEGWVAVPSGLSTPEALAPGTVQAADPFLEGFPSVMWPENEFSLASPRKLFDGADQDGATHLDSEAQSFAVLDLTGELQPEIVRTSERGLSVLSPRRPQSTALQLTLEGIKDEPRGRGAIVEVRAGPHYQRFYARGEPLLVGLGGLSQADVVRITWPNGVVQNVMDLQAGQGYLIQQKEGLVGSCPFLYAWNGETYGFITDVLGGTPLGLPMAPGMLVPPDHDEFVLLRTDQLVPRNGVYELQITEELREVTYLDRVRLDVIDHPPETEAHPNERFSFPPFPEERLHVFATPLSPVEATDDLGTDWTAELGQPDGHLAAPYRSLGGQFLGLSEPHSLELSFDPAQIPDQGPLRLALTGWFLWTDASVNMAAARHPLVEFQAPIFSVPDGEGGWRVVGESPGFPAGKAKTMVLDVGDWLVRDDPRVRVDTTLCLAWDAIRLAVGGDHESRVTSVEPTEATLWLRGFSEPSGLADEPLLETYDWDRLAETPRWNQHPGLYTRLGDVLALLGEADDRSVIFGAGDALKLSFSAGGLPPLPAGWRRDYLLYLDGWAKDRDPNTEWALNVEPLPFHGMSGYPYRSDEHFPDDEFHRAWRQEWNTRPAYHWIDPLSLFEPLALR